MSICQTKIHELVQTAQWANIPSNIQAMGEIQDPEGKTLLTISFCTHRDLISEIGYSAVASCPPLLRACAAAVCHLAFERAIMAAELIGPNEVIALISDDGSVDDQTYYFVLLAILALKNALSSYASFRSNDYMLWKNSQSNES